MKFTISCSNTSFLRGKIIFSRRVLDASFFNAATTIAESMFDGAYGDVSMPKWLSQIPHPWPRQLLFRLSHQWPEGTVAESGVNCPSCPSSTPC